MKKLLLVVVLMLTGCGDGVVKQLKNTPIPNYPEYTYGHILDSRALCDATDWDKTTSNSGIIEIKYRCILKRPIDSSLQFNSDRGNKSFKEDYAQKLSHLTKVRDDELKSADKKIVGIKSDIKRLQDIISDNKNLFSLNINVSDKQDELVGALNVPWDKK